MIYYLETNAIYHIRKLQSSMVSSSFFSVFGFIEIVAGLDYEEFHKRKSLLQAAINSGVKCDSSFPEKVIFQAFDCFDDLDFIEERIDDLLAIVDTVIASESFDEFNRIEQLENRKYDFKYFVDLDQFYTKSFYDAGVKGLTELTTALKKAEGTGFVEYAGKRHELKSRKMIADFLSEPLVNSSISTLALANTAREMAKRYSVDRSEELIYNSYNGLLKHYITGYGNYCIDQIARVGVPKRNYFQDLTHLLYLRSVPEIKIVSNDKIFSTCSPDLTASVKSLSG